MSSWTSGLPSGSNSVRANRGPMQGNYNYMEERLGKIPVGTNPVAGNNVTDHFWAMDTTLSGHHRFMKMPKFTSTNGAVLPDLDAKNPVLGTSIDGCMYIREVNTDVARVEGFYRNTQGVHQFIPSYVTGQVVVPESAFVSILTLPKNVYGDILLWVNVANPQIGVQTGFFISNETTTNGYSLLRRQSGGVITTILDLANSTQSTTLDLKVRKTEAGGSPLTYNYRITYRAVNQDG